MATDHPVLKVEVVLLVAMGGALGANLRYFVGTLLPGLGGTFVANVAGCYLLGFLLYEAVYTDLIAEETRVFFGTGFLSSFTTYSTFAVETVHAPPWLAVVNVVASYAAGFAAVVLGGRTASSWVDRSAPEAEVDE